MHLCAMWARRERSRADGTVEGGRRRRTSQADRRREREARIIYSTPELFDARGVSDAQVEGRCPCGRGEPSHDPP